MVHDMKSESSKHFRLQIRLLDSELYSNKTFSKVGREKERTKASPSKTNLTLVVWKKKLQVLDDLRQQNTKQWMTIWKPTEIE